MFESLNRKSNSTPQSDQPPPPRPAEKTNQLPISGSNQRANLVFQSAPSYTIPLTLRPAYRILQFRAARLEWHCEQGSYICQSKQQKKSGTTENGSSGTTPSFTSSPTSSATAPPFSKASAVMKPSKAPPFGACANTCSASSTLRASIAWSFLTRSMISAASHRTRARK